MIIYLHYMATFILELGFAMTSSTIMLQTMKHVSNHVYNISEIISVILSAGMFVLISFDKYREFINRYALQIILFDFISLFIIQIFSLFDLTIRYMLIAVVFPLVINLRETIVYSKVNLFLTGDDLTRFNVRNQAFKSVGRLFGYIIALFNPMSLIIALIIQIVAIIPEALVSKMWIEKR